MQNPLPLLHRSGWNISLQIILLSILIRSIGSFIDGFQDMEIRVSTKFSLLHVVLAIRVQKNTWSKTLCYLLLTWNKNLNAFKSGSFCFGLLYFSKSIWQVIYGYWYSELPKASFCYFCSYLLDFLWAIILQKLLRGKWQEKMGRIWHWCLWKNSDIFPMIWKKYMWLSKKYSCH